MKDLGLLTPFVYAAVLVGLILGLVVNAAVYKLIVVIAKGDASFHQLFSAVRFSPFTIISHLAVIFLHVPKKKTVTSLHALIQLLEQWHFIFANIDIFVIWSLILTGFLLIKVGRGSSINKTLLGLW
ncbi:hypothetical protein QUF51_06195 [Bacillus pumilus]|nr:hypothetical protein [Bacillus pumilus]OLP63204.1 hypothetical protein BACPU_34230 [Bacillus pumilus]